MNILLIIINNNITNKLLLDSKTTSYKYNDKNNTYIFGIFIQICFTKYYD